MDSPRPGKRIIGAGIDHDAISHLPGEIIDHILTKLPLKDAVRTSILSSKWRYMWASMPEIVVKDDDFVPNVDKYEPTFHFVRNIDLLLLNHKGPILKFDLSTKYLYHDAFDRWILNLSRNGITKLTFVLNLTSLPKYRIPSNFFFCDALQYVMLSGCLIELPRGFEGFKLLTTLKLDKCTVSAADLEWLVSSSPKLKILALNLIQVGDDLRIFSKGLTHLAAGGDFSNLQIDAPNLVVFGCSTLPTIVNCTINFRRSLGDLVNIRHLSLFGYTIPNIVERPPAMLLNFCLEILRYVSLDVDLGDQKESGFALSLLQNSINLQDLNLIVRRSKNTTSSSFCENDIVLKFLRTVHIDKFIAVEPVFAFIKFVLNSTPNLGRLTLTEERSGPREGSFETFKRLLKFQRASAKAEVVFK